MTPIQVGLIGCGTVGTGVVKLLTANAEDIRARLGAPVAIKRVVVADLHKTRDPEVDPAWLSTDINTILDDPDIKIVVEVIGGYEPARTHILRALDRGKHVVTANKALLARHGEELFAKASEMGVDIIFEASVGGGIPIIRSLREGLASDRIDRLYAIINGTSNFILTKMAEEGAQYQDTIALAQRLGYAEADPAMDVDGIDAAQKLSILISLAFGLRIPFENIFTESLSYLTPQDFAFAKQFGFAIKPLAVAKAHADGVEAHVHPTLIPKDSLMAAVNGVFNAAYIHSYALGPVLFYGKGAGMMPTAVSVLSDIIEMGRNLLQGTSGRLPFLAFHEKLKPGLRHKPMEEVENEYYLRFEVEDRPGVLARLAGALGEEGVSIRQMVQTDATPEEGASVALITHVAQEGRLRRALQKIDAMPTTTGRTQVIRIERP